jgi:hypothetical protein
MYLGTTIEPNYFPFKHLQKIFTLQIYVSGYNALVG